MSWFDIKWLSQLTFVSFEFSISITPIFIRNSIHLVVYLLSKILEKYYCVVKNHGDWKTLEQIYYPRDVKVTRFGRMEWELLPLQFLMRSDASSTGFGNTVARAIGTAIKMQQRVRIRLRTLRHVVRDKMLEIPDSLNEHGTTNKRHSTHRPDLDSRRNVERLSRPARIVWRSQTPR